VKSVIRLGYKIQIASAIAALLGFVGLVLLYNNEQLTVNGTRLIIALVVLVYFGSGIWLYFILRTKTIQLSPDRIIITDLIGFTSRSYPYSDITNIKTKTLRIQGRVARGNPYEGIEISFRDGFELTFSENMYTNYKKIKLFVYSKVAT
jgi:hypothetical protein